MFLAQVKKQKNDDTFFSGLIIINSIIWVVGNIHCIYLLSHKRSHVTASPIFLSFTFYPGSRFITASCLLWLGLENDVYIPLGTRGRECELHRLCAWITNCLHLSEAPQSHNYYGVDSSRMLPVALSERRLKSSADSSLLCPSLMPGALGPRDQSQVT